MASETGIVNSALRKIGASTITSLTDGSKNANVALDLYAEVRDRMLRSHAWNFAINRVKLGRLATDPAFGFNYRYQLPANFVRVVAVYDNDNDYGAVEYRLEDDGTMHADAEDIYLRYVRRVEDPNRMPPDFREAFAYQLAEEFAIAIAQSLSLCEALTEKAEKWTRMAKSADAVEDFPESMPEGSWVEDRDL